MFIMTWAPIENYENMYEVSDDGKVRSLDRIITKTFDDGSEKTYPIKGRTLKHFFSRKYPCVKLCKQNTEKTISVHRLVAAAFVPNPDNKPEVNHIDGCTTNNSAENLEWVTRQENMKHAAETSLMPPGKKRGDSVLAKPVAQYDLNGNYIKSFDSLVSAEFELTGKRYTGSKIPQVCSGARCSSRGHIWRYINDGEAVETKVPGVTHVTNVMAQVNRVEDNDTTRNAETIDSNNN